MRRLWMSVLMLCIAALLSGCGYNTIQQKDEAVNAAWSQVLNVYQRRADLVPNLVATVRGYASHEQQVLTQVTEARAQALERSRDKRNVRPPDTRRPAFAPAFGSPIAMRLTAAASAAARGASPRG